MKRIWVLLGILSVTPSAQAVEYGFFEKSSDGKYQTVCPVREDGSVVCTYSYKFQTVSAVIDQVNVGAHQQNLRALEALGPIAFYTYDEAIRKLLPTNNFLLNGFYIKFDSRTILLDFAHFYTPLQINIPYNLKSTISSVLRLLTDVYYSKTGKPNPLVKRLNHCPILIGRFDCPRNTLVVTQLNYGIDELYVFNYSDRPVPFDFGANDAGMKNAADKYVATCTDGTLNLDGSVMRLNGMRDLEFVSGGTTMVCRRQGLFLGR